jgi:hypothetical protein
MKGKYFTERHEAKRLLTKRGIVELLQSLFETPSSKFLIASCLYFVNLLKIPCIPTQTVTLRN